MWKVCRWQKDPIEGKCSQVEGDIESPFPHGLEDLAEDCDTQYPWMGLFFSFICSRCLLGSLVEAVWTVPVESLSYAVLFRGSSPSCTTLSLLFYSLYSYKYYICYHIEAGLPYGAGVFGKWRKGFMFFLAINRLHWHHRSYYIR